ncbi:MAG: tRNA (guanosine(46)-N7)-methyltransferase TrmB [Gammaproteobacteria bacterium]|nr:tRNA (guanosine(46)-N7)-methyltransferase TrmB [Gammaproteobacteria bacterium]
MRTVRSFVRREGRVTVGQQRALENHWQEYGLDYRASPLDLTTEFGREAPRCLEIGFGSGDAIISMATNHPEEDFLGIEVFRAGAGQVIAHATEHGLHNIRVMLIDAIDVLKNMIADETLDRVYVFFPDPWHKKKHHKRRLINSENAALIASKLKPGGDFFLATDWENYAQQMLQVLDECPALENTADGFAPRNERRPLTRFEKRGQRLGHGVWDLHFRKRLARHF